MFGMGIGELLVIFVIALVVFGPKRLPEIGRSVGRALAEFKKASQEFQDSIQQEMREAEKQVNTEEIKKLTSLEEPQPTVPKPEVGTPQPEKLASHDDPHAAPTQEKSEENKTHG
jgi:sec-independent protein translocase protein TatA